MIRILHSTSSMPKPRRNRWNRTSQSLRQNEEEGFDVDIPNDEFTAKSLINHFEYDSTKVKGVLIKRKPKIEEAYEDPITHMIR